MQWSLLRPVGLVAAALVLTTVAASAEGGKSAGPSEFLLVAQIVLLLLVGRVLGEVMQRIGQPAVMGQLLAGILLGPVAVRLALAGRRSMRSSPRRPSRRR